MDDNKTLELPYKALVNGNRIWLGRLNNYKIVIYFFDDKYWIAAVPLGVTTSCNWFLQMCRLYYDDFEKQQKVPKEHFKGIQKQAMIEEL